MHSVALAGQVLRWVWTHPANRGRRVRSVARAVRFQTRARLGRRTLAVIGRRGVMWAERHSHSASQAVYANPPDWNEMQAWRRLLKPGDLFVDVGSNVGSYVLWAADAGATVIAIEPSPQAAERLRENIALNDFPIVVRECGLADRPGRMRLTRGEGTMNHLILGPAAGGDEVTVDTLDQVLGDQFATGVKIDVEGAERMVLEGARRALSQRRIGVLQIEWNHRSELLLGQTREPVAKILQEYGYTFMMPDQRGALHEIAVPEMSREDIFAVAPGYQVI